MQVHFKNNYSSPVWVAYMKYDPDSCGADGNWSTHGWWNLAPGEQKWVFSTTNEFACFYAEADDGSIWTGEYGPVYVYQEPFDSCINIGSSHAIDIVGMELMTLPGDRWNPLAVFTMNLNP